MARARQYILQRQGNYVGRFYRDGGVLERKLIAPAELELTPSGRKRTEKQQQEFLQKLYNQKLAEIEKEEKKCGGAVRVKTLIEEYLSTVDVERTRAEYERVLNGFVAAAGNIDIASLNAQHGLKYKQSLKDKSPATIKSYLRQLQIFLNWCEKYDYIDKAPVLPSQKVAKREPEVITPEQMQRLNDLILQKHSSATSPKRRHEYWTHYRLFMMLRYTAMRGGEIWSLRLENIDIAAGVIRIRACDDLGWKPKAWKEADIPIADTLASYLKSDVRLPEERWYLDNACGGNMYATVDGLGKALNRYRAECGITAKRLHGFRASAITAMLRDGVPAHIVQQIARHSDLRMTMSYYNRSGTELSDAINRVK